MSRRSITLLVSGAILIAVAMWVIWFFSHFEQVEKERRKGMSKAARSNKFLAAELFLKKLNKPAESSSGRQRLIELPATSDVLIVNDIGTSLNQQRHDALLEWIRNGGYLITSANRFWDEEAKQSGNRLLDNLDIRLYRTQELKEIQEAIANGEDIPEQEDRSSNIFQQASDNILGSFGNKPVTVVLENEEEVTLYFKSNRALWDVEEIAHYQAGSEDAMHMLDIAVGDGMITVFSDMQFLKHAGNLNIAKSLDFLPSGIEEHDSAYFLWKLVENRDKVWLLYSIDALPFHKLLWSRGKLACISMVVLLLFWLWWQRNRFGPIQGSIDVPRRNLLEHIRMTAKYTWRQDKAQLLVKQNREHIKHQLLSKHPYISQLPPDEQCERLSDVLNMSAKDIHTALYAQWRNERDLINLSQQLQSLGKQL